MQCDYKVNDKLIIKFDGANQKEVFQNLAQLGEVFSISECGACGSKDIRHAVRTVPSGKQVFTYYELHCQKCRARLSFGQSTDTVTLFPKRKDDEGKYLDNGGWTKYVKPTDESA
jgi:MinD superfamily P-loop ATPase